MMSIGIGNNHEWITVNSYPANWSEEKTKKESKKTNKNYLGVADFE